MKSKLLCASPLLGLLLAVAAGQAQACYTVYDQSNRVVYQAQVPPVNMSLNIHETLPLLYPNTYMLFDNAVDCPLANNVNNRQALNNAIDTKKQTEKAMGRPAGVTPVR